MSESTAGTSGQSRHVSVISVSFCTFFHCLYQADKPDKAAYEATLKEMTDAIEALKEERKGVQTEIDNAMNDPESKEVVGKARSEMTALKNQKQVLINEKKAMRAQLDAAKNQTEKLIKDKKDTRSNLKFSTIEEIDAEIKKLQRRQETTTMSLTDEKRLIKELDSLQQSKKYVADLKTKDVAMDSVKEQRKVIASQITAKDKEIDEITKKVDAIMATLKEHNDKDTKKRDSLQGLFKKRDALKKAIGDELKKKDAFRDEFREKSNVWYNYQRAIRAQRKMEYEEEKKKRDEERAAYLAKLEEEEAKKVPYEEEQALCDYLADYLERTYLGNKSDEADDSKTEDVVTVQDDPFAGLKPVNKKYDDEYFGKGKGKKKRVRAAKKQDQASGPFTLSVDTFEQFGLINMNPPTSVDQVEQSVKDLREKKEWYKQQPRGSVPTANEIRKANEKEVAKIKHSEPGKKPAKPGTAFALSNDEFAPLGAGGGGTVVNASWGQKAPGIAESAPAAQEAS
jgi:chromosome segregation ATPase